MGPRSEPCGTPELLFVAKDDEFAESRKSKLYVELLQ